MIIDDFDRVQCEEIYNDEDQSIAQIFADLDEDGNKQ